MEDRLTSRIDLMRYLINNPDVPMFATFTHNDYLKSLGVSPLSNMTLLGPAWPCGQAIVAIANDIIKYYNEEVNV